MSATTRVLPGRRTSGRVSSASRWLPYLPELYHDNVFLEGLLLLFESLWNPMDRQISQLWVYFDPWLTPEAFLPWLATWVDLTLDENWPVAKRRQMIADAVQLYRWRGTRRGLTEYLRLYTGETPVIEEAPEGAPNPFHFTVRFRVAKPAAFNMAAARRIIEEDKPAHATYELIVEHA